MKLKEISITKDGIRPSYEFTEENMRESVDKMADAIKSGHATEIRGEEGELIGIVFSQLPEVQVFESFIPDAQVAPISPDAVLLDHVGHFDLPTGEAFKRAAAVFAIAGNGLAVTDVKVRNDFECLTVALEREKVNFQAKYGQEVFDKMLKASSDSGFSLSEIASLYDQFNVTSKMPIRFEIPTAACVENTIFEKPDRIPVPKSYKRNRFRK